MNFQAARTKYFDAFFYAAADAGVRQIVIPAAGLDSRAYRLAWPNGTVVYELDQPQVLEFKRDVLGRRGDAPTAERREIAVDLRDRLATGAAGSRASTRRGRRHGWSRGCWSICPPPRSGSSSPASTPWPHAGSHVAVDDGHADQRVEL